MQTNQFSVNRNPWLTLIFLLPLALLLFLTSCKEKKENFAGMDVSCAVLLHSKMKNAWETPGYFKSIDYFTFYSSFNRATKIFSVGVQAYDASNKAVGGYIELTQGSGCNVNLPNGVVFSDNNISLTNLNILKPDGTLMDFDYLKFTPKVCPENDINFLCFDIEAYTGGEGSGERSSLPCPPCPNCKPPCEYLEKSESMMIPKDTTVQNQK